MRCIGMEMKLDVNISSSHLNRRVDPSDIQVPPGYHVEVVAQGIDTPITIVFDEMGAMLIADSGFLSGKPKVLRLANGHIEIVAESFKVPITGIAYLNGDIYVSHRGTITVIHRDGTREDIMSGIPSNGDHSNNQVVFGTDGKMYFGLGTATNSGVVGSDNNWVLEHPFFHDYPGSFIMLNGQNFATNNILIKSNEIAYTGAFSPYGVPNSPYDTLKGFIRAGGSILRCNLDGSELELVAWGFRNPYRIKFDRYNRLFAVNHGYDERGSRPIANAPDEFQLVLSGIWYGWPDYCAGMPVTLPRFKPEVGDQPEFLLTNHPTVPPSPYTTFTPHSTPTGFDFNYNARFGPVGDVYIAEFGSYMTYPVGGIPLRGVGHRISRIDMNTRQISTFAINVTGLAASSTGGGGLERPTDLIFGPDGAMYICDMAMTTQEGFYMRDSGVIWKISRNN